MARGGGQSFVQVCSARPIRREEQQSSGVNVVNRKGRGRESYQWRSSTKPELIWHGDGLLWFFKISSQLQILMERPCCDCLSFSPTRPKPCFQIILGCNAPPSTHPPALASSYLNRRWIVYHPGHVALGVLIYRLQGGRGGGGGS